MQNLNVRAASLQSIQFQVIPTRAMVGAEVRCGDLRVLDDAGIAALRAAWLDNLVIVVRDQTLSDPDLMAFGRRLGELDSAPLAKTGNEKARAHDEVIVVSNVMEDGKPIGVLRDAEVVWHSDNSYRDVPLSFSALYALEVPPAGGDTGFANMYHALDTLPADLRRRIDTLTIKHDMTYNSVGDLRAGFKPVTDVRNAPGPSHPIVRTHFETGHNALYLGRRPNAYIDGLGVEESEQLLQTLWAHATRPELTWHHQWRVGDLLIWDNRCVMHHREPFAAGARRVMHRIQGKGDKPARKADARTGPHPRSALNAATAG
jgi:taurine dioxygenase